MAIINTNGGAGIDTSDATATASQIEAGATAYVDGEKITGTGTMSKGNIHDAFYYSGRSGSETITIPNLFVIKNNVAPKVYGAYYTNVAIAVAENNTFIQPFFYQDSTMVVSATNKNITFNLPRFDISSANGYKLLFLKEV